MPIPPLAAESLFNIGSLPVTNAMVNAWIALAFFVGVAGTIRSRVARIPRGIQNVAELILEKLLDFFDQVTHEREKSERFLPFVGTLFFFILFSNWIG
ncbi:MAG: F0F1 ATP synthase subunit A, partial [Patescibacteria group bacterium]